MLFVPKYKHRIRLVRLYFLRPNIECVQRNREKKTFGFNLKQVRLNEVRNNDRSFFFSLSPSSECCLPLTTNFSAPLCALETESSNDGAKRKWTTYLWNGFLGENCCNSSVITICLCSRWSRTFKVETNKFLAPFFPPASSFRVGLAFILVVWFNLLS